MDAVAIQQQIGSVILAGGRSSRMSENKALLRPQPGGPTLVEMVAARLEEAGLPPALLVTNTPQDYDFLGIRMVPDEIRGAGALGGILTALLHSPHARNLIVACDMHLLSPALIRHMASLPLPQDSYAFVPRWTDSTGKERVEPLHSVYSTRCTGPIRARIAQGELKLGDFLKDLSVCYLEEAELRRYDPLLQSFHNVNTPEEFRAIEVQNYRHGRLL